jgi:hypothetical protein
MKATELRIGNLIYVNGNTEHHIESVAGISETHLRVTLLIGDIPIESTLPIPITEEWLLKFGFTIDDRTDCAWKSTTELPNHNSYYQDGQFVISKNYDEELNKEYWSLTIGDYRVNLYSKLYYVHQLQNAFALTGEELKSTH